MGFRSALALGHRWLRPVWDPIRSVEGARGYGWYLRDLRRFRKLAGGAAGAPWRDTWPELHDKTASSSVDAHYFYQDNWALRLVARNKPARHVDVGSRIDTVSHMAATVPVTFIDIRPLEADLEGLDARAGSVLAMPFPDGSLESLSCLHVAEHVGLGRYGDPLDPEGTKKAAGELARVLAPGGNLYFSLPVGRPRVCFNAHRIHSPRTILEHFRGLDLVELSGVTDKEAPEPARFIRNIPIEALELAGEACGLFWFRKPGGA